MRIFMAATTLGLVVAANFMVSQVAAQPASGASRQPGSAAVTQVGHGPNGDWAFLDRYRRENDEVRARRTRNRVVFMGDSITEGWARQAFLADNAAFVGRGISGQTASQMLVRFRADVIALKPAVVHIMAGTNDVAQNNGVETPEEITGYIVSMVELAQANRIKVVLASIPPASDFFWRRGMNPGPQIQSLNGWLKTYAERQGIAYVDYWSVLAAPDGSMKAEYSPDGVHPNAAGYEAMRPLAEAALKRVLGSK